MQNEVKNGMEIYEDHKEEFDIEIRVRYLQHSTGNWINQTCSASKDRLSVVYRTLKKEGNLPSNKMSVEISPMRLLEICPNLYEEICDQIYNTEEGLDTELYKFYLICDQKTFALM